MKELERVDWTLSGYMRVESGLVRTIGWSTFTVFSAQSSKDRRSEFPECSAIADSIPGELMRISLFRLEPFGIVPRHAENKVHLWDAAGAGFHVALVTNPGCALVQWIDEVPRVIPTPVGVPVQFDWAWDHMAVNAGKTARIHMYLEKKLCDELWRYIAERRHA